MTTQQPQPPSMHRLNGSTEEDRAAVTMPASHEASITLTVANLEPLINPGAYETPGQGEPVRTPGPPPVRIEQAPENPQQAGTTGYGR